MSDAEYHHQPGDRLRQLLGAIGEDLSEPPSLEQLQKEARGYGKRRADREGSRDNLIYRAGYAVDAVLGLAIDHDELAGVLSSASLIAEAITALGDLTEKMSLLAVVEATLAQPAVKRWARQEGLYFQWERLAALYEENTTKFKASAAYADPEARWRKKQPTRAQWHLVGEICRLTDCSHPVVRTRSDAFDFIDNGGGNPRYWTAPVRTPRPRILRNAL